MAAKISQVGARIAFKDVTDLNNASEGLAAVADQIKRANPQWAPTAIQILIRANETIVRIQTKGARAFATWYEKHGVKEPPPDADELQNSESADAARGEWNEEER
jgi:hypothetical protein